MLSAYEPDEAPIRNQAISRLRDQLSQSAGSAAVTVAELPKTVAHVAHTATRLANAFRGLRKGDLGAFEAALGLQVTKRTIKAYRRGYRLKRESQSDLLQFAGNSWLEYSYGWKPLLQDVYSQAENLARFLTHHQNVVREARGTARGEKTTRSRLGGPTSDWYVDTDTLMKVRYSYVVRYKVNDPNGSIPHIFGLNNPALVAWELVPFSFVADWFLPIGDFLEGLTATSGLSFLNGTQTRRYEATVTKRVVPKDARDDQGGKRRDYFDGGTTMTQVKYGKSRVLLSSFPQPEFIPKNPFSVSHATSALALLQTVFHGSASTRAYLR